MFNTQKVEGVVWNDVYTYFTGIIVTVQDAVANRTQMFHILHIWHFRGSSP